MTEQQGPNIQPIPHTLTHLIKLNIEYGVLICMGHGCRCAVSPASISRHLRRKHHTTIELRRQVDRYIEAFPFEYNYSDIKLPADGLAPQPIIQIRDGFQCQHCAIQPFKTQSRKAVKEHGNKEHGKKRVADEDLFHPVRMQSWFWEGKERYWVVDESKPAIPFGQPRQPSHVEEDEGSNDSDSHREKGQSDDNNSQDEVDDQIVQDIERWKSHAKERQLTLLKKAPADEVDPWLRFTQWNEVLSQSQLNYI